jgi:hypothetical protein
MREGWWDRVRQVEVSLALHALDSSLAGWLTAGQLSQHLCSLPALPG